MSVNAGSVTVDLLLRLSLYNQSLRTAQSSWDKFARRIKQGITIYAVGRGLKNVVEDAANMELRLAKLRRAADSSDEGFKKLTTDIKRFAANVEGVSLEHLYEIATIGAKLGITGAQLNLFTRDMAKIRVAIDETELPTEELATRVLKLISVFHLGTDQAINLTSAMNELDLSSNATAREILDMSARMAPMAARMGMTVQKTMALATAMKQAGIMTEVGGTAIMQVIGRMANASSGTAFGKLAGTGTAGWFKMLSKDPLEALMAVERGIEKLPTLQAIRALDGLGLQGQRVRQALLGLGQVMPELHNYIAKAEEGFNDLTIAEQKNATFTKIFWAQWDKLKNNFELLSADLGESLLPLLKEFGNGLVRLMKDIRASILNNRETFMRWGKKIGEILGYVGGAWRQFWLSVEFVQEWAGSGLDFVTEAFRRMAYLSMNVMEVFGKRLVDYFGDVMKTLGAVIKNGMIDAIVEGITAMSKAVHPKIAAFLGLGDMAAMAKFAGQGQKATVVPPVFGRGNKQGVMGEAMDRFRVEAGLPPGAGFLANMPNRNAKLKELAGKIANANADAEKEHQKELADDNAADELARFKARRARGGFLGPPELRPRRPNLVGLLRGGPRDPNSPLARAIQKEKQDAADQVRKANKGMFGQSIQEAVDARVRREGLRKDIADEKKKAKETVANNLGRLPNAPEVELPLQIGLPPNPFFDRLSERERTRIEAVRKARREREMQRQLRTRGAVEGARMMGPVAPAPETEKEPIEEVVGEAKKTNDKLDQVIRGLELVALGIHDLGMT